MTTETILTEAEIFECFDKSNGTVCIDYYPDELFEMGRAIEQAVLQSEQVQEWKRDAETDIAIQRAAQVLPRDWQITIEVEQGSGYVNLYFQGNEIEFDYNPESISESLEAATNAAMEQQK